MVDTADLTHVSRGSDGLPSLGRSLRQNHFYLAKELSPVNNGSFGAVPRRVLAAQVRFLEEMERDPEAWFRVKVPQLYRTTVNKLAAFVGAKSSNIVLVENVTSGLNCILKSFAFTAGDQVLMTSHAYKANRTLMDFMAETTGVRGVTVDIPWQTTKEEILRLFVDTIETKPDIKLAVVEHITCGSAIVLPVAEIIDICHDHGVVVVVDGAHGPGQLPLNMEQLAPDFYLANLNKWMFAPKGCGMMYVHESHHSWIKPLVAAYRIHEDGLHERFYFNGTTDHSSLFAITEALDFHQYLGGLGRITKYNSTLKDWAADMLAEAWNAERVLLSPELRAPFMCLLRLPLTTELEKYEGLNGQRKVYIELARQNVCARFVFDDTWKYLRISTHVYNTEEDYLTLRDVMGEKLELIQRKSKL